MLYSYLIGRRFEARVGCLLQAVKTAHPKRVTLEPQKEVKLKDGRSKFIDFALDYRMKSSNHQVAVECQDRRSWSSQILDKILAIRSHSHRNRFWFVYCKDGFLTNQARVLLDSHGILHFSFREFERHLKAVGEDLKGADLMSKRPEDLIEQASKLPDEVVEQMMKRLSTDDLLKWASELPPSPPFQRRDDYQPPNDAAMLS